MLETNVIPIKYKDESKEEAFRLKEILESNETLFQMFLAGHKSISFLEEEEDDESLEISSIDDFKSLLKEFIPSYIDMLKERVYTSSDENIETIFLRILILDKNSPDELDENLSYDINLNINTIYSILGLMYYEDDEKLTDFIFNPTITEKEKIYEWLNNKERYNLINMLLCEEYQKLLELESIENDSYLSTHLEELLELSELDIVDRFSKKEKRTDLPELKETELDRLCSEFFIKIDPSLKWLKIYQEFKQNHNILYGETFPDSCSDWGCVETTDNIYIYAPLDGTIRDFMYFIHEFAHAVTLLNKEKGECIPSSIQEFPSIFFERCATAFLRDKGYSDKDVTDLEEERLNATLSNKSDISPSLRYLIDYLTYGEITFDKEKEKMDRIRSSIPENLPEDVIDLLNMLMSTEDEENVHVKIDAENAFLLEHPNCIFEEYPYIVGNNLADQTIGRVGENPLLIYTMLSITENLTSETYQSVLSKLGFRTSIKKENKKQHKKMRTK